MYSYFVKAINYDGGEYSVAILSRFKILDSIHLTLPIAEEISGEAREMGTIKVRIKRKKILSTNTYLGIVKEYRNYKPLPSLIIFLKVHYQSFLPGILMICRKAKHLIQLKILTFSFWAVT